jgi:hypothetical protein
LHEVLDRIWNRGGRRGSLPRPEKATPASAEGRGSTGEPTRTHGAAQLDSSQAQVAWPRASVAYSHAVWRRWTRTLAELRRRAAAATAEQLLACARPRKHSARFSVAGGSLTTGCCGLSPRGHGSFTGSSMLRRRRHGVVLGAGSAAVIGRRGGSEAAASF